MKKPIGHALPDYNLDEPTCNVECPCCSGEGKTYDEDGYSECHICKGSGSLDSDDDYFKETCENCGADTWNPTELDDEFYCESCVVDCDGCGEKCMVFTRDEECYCEDCHPIAD